MKSPAVCPEYDGARTGPSFSLFTCIVMCLLVIFHGSCLCHFLNSFCPKMYFAVMYALHMSFNIPALAFCYPLGIGLRLLSREDKWMEAAHCAEALETTEVTVAGMPHVTCVCCFSCGWLLSFQLTCYIYTIFLVGKCMYIPCSIFITQ